MDYIRGLISGVLTGIAAFLHPIAGDVFSLLLIFGFNFLCGLIAAYCAGEDFELRKAFRCIVEACMFFVLVASIYAIGHFKHNPVGALQCVSFVAYSVIYFYSINCLRNLRLILKQGTPSWQVINFIYFVVSIEFVKKIPVLRNYINMQGKHRNENFA